jgi:hypothetical protein
LGAEDDVAKVIGVAAEDLPHGEDEIADYGSRQNVPADGEQGGQTFCLDDVLRVRVMVMGPVLWCWTLRPAWW